MPGLLLIWARGFHFGSGMILAGVVAFRWFVLLPSFTPEADEIWEKFASFFHALQRVYVAAAVVLVLSGLASLWAVAAGMSDTSLSESLSTDTLGTVVFQTQFGAVCQWQLGLLAIFLLTLGKLSWNRWLFQRGVSPLEILGGMLAAALVVSTAWTGHAAATGGPEFWWRILADSIHLLTASIWPTGLLPFALFLGCARKIDDLPRLRPVLVAVRRFSNVSLVTVSLLALTGMINSTFMVGSFHALVTTNYGRLLSLKLFVFFLMLTIAAWNRYRLVPLLFGDAATPARKPALARLRPLHVFVVIELGLAVAVIAIVSILGTTPPPN